MCRWLEVVLCLAVLACALLPALARCDVSTRPSPPCEPRAMEDFAYMLATSQDAAQCERAPPDPQGSGDTVAE